MKPIALLLGALVVLLLAGPARAEGVPRAFRLDVQGDGCTGAEDLREALAIALGKDPIDARAGSRLVVRVLAGSSLARARWQVLDAQGAPIRERTITVTGGCRALVRELALSIAVAYETDAPPPSPAVACDAACRAEVRAEICREHPRSCMDIVPVLLAGGALSLGLTADPGGGAWLAGEVRFGETFSAAIDARVLFPSRVVPTAGETFDLTMVSFGLVPCARWKWLLGCVTADLGMFIGSGIYAPGGGPTVLATFGVGPRLAAQVPITERFGLRAFADLRIAPIPTHVGFQDSPGTWDSNPVSGLFGLGVTFE